MHRMKRAHAIGYPASVAARLRAGRAKPIPGRVAAIARVAQPSNFVELMSSRAADGAKSAAPEGAIDEFSKAVSAGSGPEGQVLGDQFPAVIVGGDNVAVRTIEERNIALVPIPVAI